MQSDAGMAKVVEDLEGVLRRMLGESAPLPRVLFTDRGTGMYAANGYIIKDFANAVENENFRTYWGSNAKQQSPDMGHSRTIIMEGYGQVDECRLQPNRTKIMRRRVQILSNSEICCHTIAKEFVYSEKNTTSVECAKQIMGHVET